MRKIVAGFALLLAALCSWGAQMRSRGVSTAPILIDIYSDFQCPACKVLHENTLGQLAYDYADKGKVYLVHHEFPLPMHAHAMEAACYACAASRVGKYQQVSDVLFHSQEIWAANGKVDETVCSILTPAEAKKVRARAAFLGRRTAARGARREREGRARSGQRRGGGGGGGGGAGS